MTTPAYVRPTEAPTTQPPIQVTPDNVPNAEDVPVVAPYVPCTEPPAQKPSTEAPVPLSVPYGGVAQDVSAATTPPVTFKYVLNEAPAKGTGPL